MNETRNTNIAILDNKNSLQEERIQALFQLMNIADTESLNCIIRVLESDPCEIVRHEAAFTLGETASSEMIPHLKKAALNDSSGIVRHEALLALGTLADKSVIPFLKEQMESPIKLVSESAKIALQRIEVIPKPYRGPEHFSNIKE